MFFIIYYRINFEKFCDCLDYPTSYFTTEEIVINDVSMLSSVVKFDLASFVVVSCRFEQDSKDVPQEMKVQIRSLTPTAPSNSSGKAFSTPIWAHSIIKSTFNNTNPVQKSTNVPTFVLFIIFYGSNLKTFSDVFTKWAILGPILIKCSSSQISNHLLNSKYVNEEKVDLVVFSAGIRTHDLRSTLHSCRFLTAITEQK